MIDYFLRRGEFASAGSFWTIKMLIASSFPCMSNAIWFIPVALGDCELAYSLAITVLGLYLAFRMDEGLEQVEFRPALKTLIWLAFAAAVVTYVGFSFHVPNNFFIVVE